MDRPENYQQLQKSWSVGRSKTMEEAARARVRIAVERIKQEGLRTDNVLVLGPQHGFELLEFRDQGFSKILAVDVVPMFCEDCQSLGFDCYQSDIEKLQEVVSGRWNVYASHILEHCYDPAAAVQQIENVCDQWCYVGVPIEPVGGNAGHCNPIRSHEHLAAMFPSPAWRQVHYEFRPSSSGSKSTSIGSVEAMYVRGDIH